MLEEEEERISWERGKFPTSSTYVVAAESPGRPGAPDNRASESGLVRPLSGVSSTLQQRTGQAGQRGRIPPDSETRTSGLVRPLSGVSSTLQQRTGQAGQRGRIAPDSEARMSGLVRVLSGVSSTLQHGTGHIGQGSGQFRKPRAGRPGSCPGFCPGPTESRRTIPKTGGEHREGFKLFAPR